MKYCITINNKRYEIEVEKGNAAIVNKTEIAVEVLENKVTTNTEPALAASNAAAKASDTPMAAVTPKVAETPEQTVVESPAAGKEVVKAPMAGTILDVKTRVGSIVRTGDILLFLEAMKMENEITAHVDGIVSELRVSKGSNVSAGDVLVVIR